jgi:hypothetical protein
VATNKPEQVLKRLSNQCNATTKKKKPCPIYVEDWRIGGLCHVHDPNGKFRQQIKSGEARARRRLGPKIKQESPCQHKWYMRDPGIQCKKCLVIWHEGVS